MSSRAFSGEDTPKRSKPPLANELRNNVETDERPDAGLGVDEQNLRSEFHDYDLESNLDGGRSRMTLDSAPDTAGGLRSRSPHRGTRGRNRNRWQPQDDEDEEENDVPASLLMERNETDGLGDLELGVARHSRHAEQPLPTGHLPHRGRGRWDTPRPGRAPHRDGQGAPASDSFPANPIAPRVAASSARDKAAWRWVNITNLDQFMLDVYNYYDGCGMWCILTDRGLHLL